MRLPDERDDVLQNELCCRLSPGFQRRPTVRRPGLPGHYSSPWTPFFPSRRDVLRHAIVAGQVSPRIAGDGDVVRNEIAEASLGRQYGQAGPMLNTIESLFFNRGDEPVAIEHGSGGVAVECV